MQCRWKVECPSTSALPHGKPVVSLRRIGTEPGFDTLRIYDGDSAPADLCETVRRARIPFGGEDLLSLRLVCV